MRCRGGLLTALLLLASAAWPAPSATTILTQYLQRLGRAEYTASEVISERQADGTPIVVRSEVKHKAGRERFAFTKGPGPYRGVVAADDGNRHVVYMPAEKRAYYYPSVASTFEQRRRKELGEAGERFELALLGQETVAGRTTWHLRLTARKQPGPRVDVWIDSQQFVALRQETRVRDQLWRSSVFQQVDFSPNLPANAFAFEAPDGVQQVKVTSEAETARVPTMRFASARELRGRVGVRAMQPKYIPEGFRFDSLLLYPPAPSNPFHRRLAARYVRGTSVLVLNQGAMPPGRGRGGPLPPSEPREVKPNVLFWSKQNLRLLLIGPRDLGADELRRAANSVDWYDT
ncbi:MAG: DUF2092 domain-containing protein [Armatimonadetes bacterium]|nr:DUF2092 domain-containing protein [Armatimonadota bacterium]